jgi:hypothetical protein
MGGPSICPACDCMPPERRVKDLAAENRHLRDLLTADPGLVLARDEFLAASVAVWREIDQLDAGPYGYHPVHMSVELRKAERAAWEKYRDLLDARPASMLEPVTFAADDDESGLRRVPMRPVDEAEDAW